MAAQLLPVDIVAPGSFGLIREGQGRLLNPLWATKATNFEINKNGILAARNGYIDSTATAIGSTPNVETIHEYITGAGAVETIVAWDGGIGNDIDDPAGNDVSASITDADGNWMMVNFNDKCIAVQAGQKLAIYTGTTFVTVSESSGTAPTGGVVAAAYGRIWQSAADGSTLHYSGLLDEADWGGAGAGTIDLNKIWTDGQDRITAIRGFNGYVVVWGMRHVIIIADKTQAELGIDPSTLFVEDVISGTGCVDQKTVQSIGETDIAFLSTAGVQSLARVIQEKSNPTVNWSESIRTDLSTAYRLATAGTIRSAYDADTGRYFLTFAGSKTYVFNTSRIRSDEQGKPQVPIFEWDLAPTAWCVLDAGTILLGLAGNIGTLQGTTDDGASISLLYETGWLNLGEDLGNRLKMLKRIGATIFTTQSGDITYKWSTDFDTTFDTTVVTLTAPAGAAEWGLGEWGLSEFAGDLAVSIFKIPARAKGQYYKLGIATTTNKSFSIQQVELALKIGRLA